MSAQAAAHAAPADLYDCRDAFADTLVELAQADPRVVAVVNDSLGSTKVTKLDKVLPGQVVNVGIAEQNMVGVGAGLANGGKIPFVCGATPFLTARALEQIKVDAAYSAANIKFVGVSSGVAYGELGPTHHSIEDIAWLRVIDRLSVIVPADPVETVQAIRAAYEHEGPVFVRTSRIGVPIIHAPDYRFRIGVAARLRDGCRRDHHRQRRHGGAGAQRCHDAGGRGHRGTRAEHGHGGTTRSRGRAGRCP